MRFLSRISPKRVSSLGKLLGGLAYALDSRHRRIARRNLEFTHPSWSRRQIRELTRRVFQNTATTLLEIFQIALFSEADIPKRVRIRGEENLRRVVEGSEGAVMISAHLGNWEMAHLAVSHYSGRSLLLVARRIRPAFVDKALNRLRKRFGNIIIDKKKAVPQMARRLHRGNTVGLLIDQEPKHSRGVDVSFFGKPTTVTPGPALLARRYGTPILPAFCVRERDGKLTLIVDPPIEPVKSNDSERDLKRNVQAMASSIERAIRTYPDQWFWFHKRWKHHFPYLYKEDLERLRRRRAKRGKA